MLEVIQQNIEQIAGICRRHGVKRLELFGSAARDDFHQTSSDIDCFYEFDRGIEKSIADRFFGLWEDLEALFGHKVDLVSAKDAKNPYFLRSCQPPSGNAVCGLNLRNIFKICWKRLKPSSTTLADARAQNMHNFAGCEMP